MPEVRLLDTGLGSLDAGRLVTEIEEYLAAQPRPTAHPLVSKTTQELVAEALGTTLPGAMGAPSLRPPGRLVGVLPDWMLPGLRQAHGAGRTVTVAEHLALTVLLIERHGWAQGRLKSWRGGRCILGAQTVLLRLGYGDDATAREAARRLQAVLTARGIDQPYHEWNDHPDRTVDEALYLLRQAADRARK